MRTEGKGEGKTIKKSILLQQMHSCCVEGLNFVSQETYSNSGNTAFRLVILLSNLKLSSHL